MNFELSPLFSTWNNWIRKWSTRVMTGCYFCPCIRNPKLWEKKGKPSLQKREKPVGWWGWEAWSQEIWPLWTKGSRKAKSVSSPPLSPSRLLTSYGQSFSIYFLTPKSNSSFCLNIFYPHDSWNCSIFNMEENGCGGVANSCTCSLSRIKPRNVFLDGL